jgi:hypothetical protein
MSRPSEVEQVLVETLRSNMDPLRSNVAFPHSIVVYPLGFPLQLESNSELIIRAAQESWAQFPQAFDEPPVRLSLGVSGYSGECPPPVFLSREHLLSIVSDSQNSVICDLAQGFGFGWVTEGVSATRPFLRYHFLDAAVLTMVGELYLTPVHGGLIERDGHGILLCGQSFAGKSTLTYACARSGWTLISDDGTFLVRRRGDRYGIGNPYSIRFRSRILIIAITAFCAARVTQAESAASCAKLADPRIDGVEITKATLIPAGATVPPPYPGAPSYKGALPAHCRVDGVINGAKA